ncbi:MAG: hypothetical protein EXR48_02685 [Dehalococcoidia bacterium]|nr:hypothetical protein [Dehalococcoidia bacterium]
MNGDHHADPEEIIKALKEAATFSFFFPALRKTLLVDLRSNAASAPFVKLLPMARTPEERIQYLNRMRPNLPKLTTFAPIPWTRGVRSLETTGVLRVLLELVAASGDAAAVRTVQEVVHELLRLEQVELVAAVRGDSYQTIWASPKR